MKRKSRHASFDQTLELVRARGFETAASAEVAEGVLVSKGGVGAVLVAASEAQEAEGVAAAFAVPPGVLIAGEIARLLDRGYQKFLRISQGELPASASQLHAIHAFSEELRLLTGAMSLYNESLGSTSEVHRYDRLLGREDAQPASAQPWKLAAGH